MIKFAGLLILVAGTTSVGVYTVRQMEYREKLLRGLVESLELLEWELSFRRPRMKELFCHLASKMTGAVASFYLACAERVDQTEVSLANVWELSAYEHLKGLNDEDFEALLVLGSVLGQYDVQSQKESVVAVCERLRGCMSQAAEQRRQKGKVYSTVGAAAGILIGVLLL